MDNLGAIVGPILAIVLVAAVGTRWAIALSVIPGLAAAVAILYAIRHTSTPTARDRVPIRLRVRPVLAAKGLRRLFGAVTAFELGKCAATLLILRATELLAPGHGDDDAATIALWLYVAYNVAATTTSVSAGHLADRRSGRFVFTLGASAFAIAYSGFTIDTTSLQGLAPWFVLAGIGIGCIETAEHAAAAGDAPAEVRGSAFGLLAATQSLGNLAASAVAGILWTALSPTWAFAYLAAWMVVAAALLAASGRRWLPISR